MLNQTTSEDTGNVTFSQALEDGLTHLDWLDGRMIGPALRDPVLVAHSVLPEKVKEWQTDATYGPLFGGSSPSEDLQTSLANRLRATWDVTGSPEYVLTWKGWDMRLGPPICALQASEVPRSGKDCSGWPTATSRDAKGGYYGGRIRNNKISNDTLDTVAQLTGADPSSGLALIESGDAFPLAGYPTARTPTGGAESAERKQELGRRRSGGGDLQATAELFRIPCLVETKLNHRFSLWLMGYPEGWASCGERATRLCQKSQRSGSKSV